MTEDSKRGHLYAVKVLSLIIASASLIAALSYFSPTSLIVLFAVVFSVAIFANIYSILYEMGKRK